MPTMEQIAELLALAEKRAATEVETWIPEKPGDKISGIVVEVGSITTKFGDYATTTITPTGKPDALVRVAWMGAVLQAQYLRMRPGPDDLVAFHYQKDVAPQNGMNEYALIVAVVLDPTTGKSKMPVDLSITVPTTEQIVNADPNTGEVFTHVDPLAPRADEEDF